MRRYLFLTVTLLLFFSLTATPFAATYYVKPDGNDNLDGRSDASAWKTIGKINSYSFTIGDDVYFKCAGTWAGAQLIVAWGGTSADRVTVGAYYMSEGSEIHGVSGNKPIIDGNDSVPDQYDGLVKVTGNYADVENLSIKNSEGKGILVYESSNNNVTGCYIENTYRRGIHYQTVDTGNIEDNELNDCARFREETGPYYEVSLGPTESSNLNIRRNIVHDTHGEGINLFNNNSNILVEYNIIYDVRSVAMYVDASRNVIIRYNLIYNTSDRTYWRAADYPGQGIWVTYEPWSPSELSIENIYIYGNLVAWCRWGLAIDTGQASPTNVFMFNNTIVDCWVNMWVGGGPFINVNVKNNIFWKISDNCTMTELSGQASQINWGYNNWSHSVSGPASATSDVTGLPKLRKTTGWRSVNGGDLNGTEFALESNSPNVDAGTNLGKEFGYIPECDQSDWKAKNFLLVSQDSQGSGWEIGADIHVANPSLTPPSRLRILGGQ